MKEQTVDVVYTGEERSGELKRAGGLGFEGRS